MFPSNGLITRRPASLPRVRDGASSPASSVLSRHCDFLPSLPPRFVSLDEGLRFSFAGIYILRRLHTYRQTGGQRAGTVNEPFCVIALPSLSVAVIT